MEARVHKRGQVSGLARRTRVGWLGAREGQEREGAIGPTAGSGPRGRKEGKAGGGGRLGCREEFWLGERREREK